MWNCERRNYFDDLNRPRLCMKIFVSDVKLWASKLLWWFKSSAFVRENFSWVKLKLWASQLFRWFKSSAFVRENFSGVDFVEAVWTLSAKVPRRPRESFGILRSRWKSSCCVGEPAPLGGALSCRRTRSGHDFFRALQFEMRLLSELFNQSRRLRSKNFRRTTCRNFFGATDSRGGKYWTRHADTLRR